MAENVELHSGKLTLRPVHDLDFPGVAAAGRDPAIRRLPWFGPKFEDAWAQDWVRRAREEWIVGRNLVFTILDDQESYIGSVNVGLGTADFIELAYWVLPESRGRGVATEALRAVLAWSRSTFPKAHIWAKTSLLNIPSQRVLLKCGFKESARDVRVYFNWEG